MREQCLVAEARPIDARNFMNLEGDWIKDLKYNTVDHVEKQYTSVIDMKQETLKDVHIGDMITFIEEIKEVTLEQALFKSMCVRWRPSRENH